MNTRKVNGGNGVGEKEIYRGNSKFLVLIRGNREKGKVRALTG